MPPSLSRLLPRRRRLFSSSATSLQATTYLLGIALFSVAFLVFLNSALSFVVTDRLGRRTGVGNVVGTLGFADELVALAACPAWGLASDRLGVRWVAAAGYAIVALALALVVRARNVYPELLLARILFAVGASATATMVTAILPSLTGDANRPDGDLPCCGGAPKRARDPRHSAVFSVESEATITPERYSRSLSRDRDADGDSDDRPSRSGSAALRDEKDARSRPAVLAGFVGFFTGCGALLALVCFLPLPVRFSAIDGVTPGDAIAYSFYVVAVVAAVVAVFVFVGLRNLPGEGGKGWRVLLGRRSWYKAQLDHEAGDHSEKVVVPYFGLVKDSVLLAFADSRIGLGYVGGFVARASTVAISLFIPLYVNTFYISRGFCAGSPHDPSPVLREKCRAAYILSSVLTGVAQLAGLVCAPLYGYITSSSSSTSSRRRRVNYPVVAAAVLGIVGYLVLPQLPSPETSNVDGRGGSPAVFVVVVLLGVSQIGSIVCSLGVLGEGVLAVDERRERRVAATSPRRCDHDATSSIAPTDDEADDDSNRPGSRIHISADDDEYTTVAGGSGGSSRVRLKGSIAGVYSLCGGAAILLLTKLGGHLFDTVSTGAPFYMMAGFNAVLLVVSLWADAARAFARV